MSYVAYASVTDDTSDRYKSAPTLCVGGPVIIKKTVTFTEGTSTKTNIDNRPIDHVPDIYGKRDIFVTNKIEGFTSTICDIETKTLAPGLKTKKLHPSALDILWSRDCNNACGDHLASVYGMHETPWHPRLLLQLHKMVIFVTMEVNGLVTVPRGRGT